MTDSSSAQAGLGSFLAPSDRVAEGGRDPNVEEALPTRWHRGMKPSPACDWARLGFVFHGLFF
jgi:hypothetical protein